MTIQPTARYSYTIVGDRTNFTATAVCGVLDDDPTVDEWQVTSAGAIESSAYSLEYAERSPTAWRPYIAPIKIIMCIGVFLMLLQAIAFFFRDVAKIRGEKI